MTLDLCTLARNPARPGRVTGKLRAGLITVLAGPGGSMTRPLP